MLQGESKIEEFPHCENSSYVPFTARGSPQEQGTPKRGAFFVVLPSEGESKMEEFPQRGNSSYVPFTARGNRSRDRIALRKCICSCSATRAASYCSLHLPLAAVANVPPQGAGLTCFCQSQVPLFIAIIAF